MNLRNDMKRWGKDEACGADRERTGQGRLHAVDWAVRFGAEADVMAAMERSLRRRRHRRLKAVCGLSAVAVVALSAVLSWRSPAFPFRLRDAGDSAPLATTVGHSSMIVTRPEELRLSDGSIVQLAPGASVREAFSADVRRLHLERGEAHFQVARNPNRPFVVEAGAISVRAVGTAFAVQVSEVASEVVVTEGRVAVEAVAAAAVDAAASSGTPEAQSAASSPAPAVRKVVAPSSTVARLEAGDRFVLDSGSRIEKTTTRVERLSAERLAARLSWRVPNVEFSGTLLEEALPLLNRHRTVPLVLADPSIGRVRLSGVLRADNADTLLRLLEEEHGIVGRSVGQAQPVLELRRAGKIFCALFLRDRLP